MKSFNLHSAHLLLSLVATCCLLLSLTVMRKTSIARGLRGNSARSAAKMKIWDRISKLREALWTGCVGLSGKTVRPTADLGVRPVIVEQAKVLYGQHGD